MASPLGKAKQQTKVPVLLGYWWKISLHACHWRPFWREQSRSVTAGQWANSLWVKIYWCFASLKFHYNSRFSTVFFTAVDSADRTPRRKHILYQFCRVAHARAHLIMQTCEWLKREFRLTCDVQSCVLAHFASKTPLHPSCFIPHFSAFLRPSLRSVPHRHRPHPLHDRWLESGVLRVLFRWKEDSLATCSKTTLEPTQFLLNKARLRPRWLLQKSSMSLQDYQVAMDKQLMQYLPTGKIGGGSQIDQNSKFGMSRCLDTSTESQMAKIMVQYGWSRGTSWTKFVWSSVSRIAME